MVRNFASDFDIDIDLLEIKAHFLCIMKIFAEEGNQFLACSKLRVLSTGGGGGDGRIFHVYETNNCESSIFDKQYNNSFSQDKPSSALKSISQSKYLLVK